MYGRLNDKLPRPPVLPETGLALAWSMTNSLSSGLTSKAAGEAVAKSVANRMQEIRSSLLKQAGEDSSKYRDLQYVDAVFSAVEASFRSLLTVLNGRNENFDQIKELRKIENERIKSLKNASRDFQSLLPRISLVGTGALAGIAAGVSSPPFLEGLFGTIGGLLAYVISELYILPRASKESVDVLIQVDYSDDLYYDQYVGRSKNILVSLFHEIIGIYTSIYGQAYDLTYEDPEKSVDAAEVAAEMVMNMEKVDSLLPHRCQYLDRHYVRTFDKDHRKDGAAKKSRKRVITPYLWPICETGQGIQECPLYKDEQISQSSL